MVIMISLAAAVMDMLSSGSGPNGVADMVEGGLYRMVGGDGGDPGEDGGGLCLCLEMCMEGLGEGDEDE
jgi:hypothetical protein